MGQVLQGSASWRRAWSHVRLPAGGGRVIYYTTNAIESINARLRKIIRGHFSSDDAATKLIWLALCNITAD